MNDLIDEQELLAAFTGLRPDREAFEAGVRSRLNSMTQLPSVLGQSDVQSPWLQVAASIVPLSLFNKSLVPGAVIPLAKVSLGYKLWFYAALPAVSVLLMVTATLFALIRIRQAHQSPASKCLDAAQQQLAILKKWWVTYGFIPACLSLAGLLLALAGYAFPMFIFFLCSGVAMLALVTRLGRAGLLDRSTVGSNLVPSLIGLAQVSQIATMVDPGYHLLDQGLVMLIPMLAAVTLGFMLASGPLKSWPLVAKAIGLAIAVVVIMSFFGRSIWNPMTTASMKSHVEAFDRARFSSASWQRWAVPTVWLQQSGVRLDLSKPRSLLETEIAGEQNVFILGVASRSGLIVPADLPRVRDLFNRRRDLLNPDSRSQRLTSIEQQEFAIRGLVMLDQWKEGERELLESRLLETIRHATEPESGGMGEALIATQLLVALDRPCMDPTLRQRVQQKLVAMQRVQYQFGSRAGGFAPYPASKHGDPSTTCAAVELMDHYGVPPELNLMALRSFLRPSFTENWMNDVSAIRVATKMRLERLPAVPPLTWLDYVRYETTIAMAVVFSLLCVFATLGCPNLSSTRHPVGSCERMAQNGTSS